MSKEKKTGPIPEDKRAVARAMLEAGKTYREVSEVLDVSVGSVHNIMKEDPGEVGPLVEAVRARFAKKCYLLADHMLSRIADWNIRDASLKDKVLAAAILFDKARQIEAGEKLRPAGKGRKTSPENGDGALNRDEQENQPVPH